MNARCGLLAFGASLFLMGSKCSFAALPLSDFAVDLERHFNVPSAVASNAVVELVRSESGKLITQDSASGLMVIKLPTPKWTNGIYFNVFIKPGRRENSTTVLVMPRTRTAKVVGGQDAYFFEKLLQKLPVS